MENNMTCHSCGQESMGGSNCCGQSHHRHFLLRMLLGIVILMIVFSLGVKIGEFKGMFENEGFGNHRMMRSNYNYDNSYPADSMMGTGANQ